jgi:cytochrome b6-f complex iron-sulfur subunit
MGSGGRGAVISADQLEDLFMNQGRRDFCRGVASVAACSGGLATLLAGCGGGNATSSIPGQPLATVTGSVTNGTVTVAVGAGSPLSAVGSMALVTSAAGNFLVTRSAQDTFVCVTADCTHQACTVSNASGQNYVCPCHGSEFDTSGRVIVGPAVAPLRQYATQFAGGVLTIT